MRQIIDVPRREGLNLFLNQRAGNLEPLLSKLFSYLHFFRNKAGRAFLRFAPLSGGLLKRTLYRGLVHCSPLSARLLVQICFPESGAGSGNGDDIDDRMEGGESGVIVRALFRQKDDCRIVGVNELLVKRSELQLLLCGKPWLLYAHDVESQAEMCKWLSTQLRFERKEEAARGSRQPSLRFQSPFRLFLSREIDVGNAGTEGLMLAGRRYRITANIDETRRGITFSAQAHDSATKEEGSDRQNNELLSCTISIDEIRALTGRWPVEMTEPKKTHISRNIEWTTALPAAMPMTSDQRPFTAPGKMHVVESSGPVTASAVAATSTGNGATSAVTALQKQYRGPPPLAQLLRRLVVAHDQLKINRDVVTQELRMAGAPVKLVASVHGDNILFVASQLKDEDKDLEEIKKVEAEMPKQAREKISKAVEAVATEHNAELEALEIALKKEQEEKQLLMEKVEAETTIAEEQIASLSAAATAAREVVRKAKQAVAELTPNVNEDSYDEEGADGA